MHGDWDVPYDGLVRAGQRRAAQAHRHHDGYRERAAPLALLRGHDRLHAGDGEGLPPASDHAALRPRGCVDLTRYVVLRLYSMGLTLVGLSVLVFLMLRLIPGTVVEQMIGADAIVSPAMVAELRRFFGLDQPWWVQYVRWIGELLQGNLGTSWRTGNAVVALILERLPVTLELTML